MSICSIFCLISTATVGTVYLSTTTSTPSLTPYRSPATTIYSSKENRSRNRLRIEKSAFGPSTHYSTFVSNIMLAIVPESVEEFPFCKGMFGQNCRIQFLLSIKIKVSFLFLMSSCHFLQTHQWNGPDFHRSDRGSNPGRGSKISCLLLHYRAAPLASV